MGLFENESGNHIFRNFNYWLFFKIRNTCRSPIMYDLVCTAWSQADANSVTLIIKCFETTNKLHESKNEIS